MGQRSHFNKQEVAYLVIPSPYTETKGKLLGFLLVLVCPIETSDLFYKSDFIWSIWLCGNQMQAMGDSIVLAAHVYYKQHFPANAEPEY